MTRERWKCGTGGFTTDEGISYSIIGAGTRVPAEGEIERLASRITGAINAADFDWPPPTAWLSEFSAIKGALKRLDAARAELDSRHRRALEHMKAKGAVLGEAVCYAGIGAAQDDADQAEREFEQAARALLAKLGEEIRP